MRTRRNLVQEYSQTGREACLMCRLNRRDLVSEIFRASVTANNGFLIGCSDHMNVDALQFVTIKKG